MSVFLQPLQTVTVGSGGASTITFSNIPQTYTDLVLKISARADTTNSPYIDQDLILRFNGVSSSYSDTRLVGTWSSAISVRDSGGNMYGPQIAPSNATSNTFSSNEIYIPNYANSNYKSVIIDSVNESNTTTSNGGYQMRFTAGLWSNTAAITSITFFSALGNIVQYSVFSLYGVLRQGI